MFILSSRRILINLFIGGLLATSFIRASSFPLDSSEAEMVESVSTSILTIDGTTKVFGALDQARYNFGSPLLVNLLVPTHKAFGNNVFFLRAWSFAAFLASILLFRYLLQYFKFRNRALYLTVFASSFLPFYCAVKISPAIYFFFFSFLALFLIFRFFIEERGNFWQNAVLAACFIILPATHYLSLVFISALDLAAVASILLFSKGKVGKLGNLLFLNLFLLIPLSTWADVTVAYFSRLKTVTYSPSLKDILIDLRYIFGRLAGGAELFGVLISFALLISIVASLVFLKNHVRTFSEKDKFTAFVLAFFAFLVILIARFPFLIPSLQDNSLFLFPSPFILLFSAADYFTKLKIPSLNLIIFAFLSTLIFSNILSIYLFLAYPSG